MTRFSHDAAVRQDFPQLAVAALRLSGITNTPDISDTAQPFLDQAHARLDAGPESEFPEIAAWRRAFSQMGLKPTQYRCASEALLRRLKKEGTLPAIHPLVDLCNAVSVAYAIPIAVFDIANISGGLTVRRANGTETYLTFGGAIEAPEPGEVIFIDDANHAHARRWTNRQSALSAIRPQTTDVLIVTEALHERAQADVTLLRSALTDALAHHWDEAAVARD